MFIYLDDTSIYAEPEFSDKVPEVLKRAFTATVRSYNDANYAAAMTQARRTMEGLFKYLVEAEKRDLRLVDLIDYVAKNKDLAEPISKLSHAIRSGGNIGAHFDMETEPSKEIAFQLLELLHYLVEFLYEIPSKISQLESEIQKPM